MFWNKAVTLYIDDTSLRLLAVQGQKVLKWADVNLEPGLVKGSIVLKEDEVAGKITGLLKDCGITARKIYLGFSGLHSLTRPVTLPELPKAMLPEAIAREARRVLPVPLDQLYLSWRLTPSPRGRVQAFMAATPRKTADSLMKTLQSAGLQVRHMAIKPLVLTRLVPVNHAVLVDVQPHEYDIVIMSEGIPQPIRTVNLPDTELSWNQKLDMIINDLQRTIQFFDTNNPEKPLAPTVPLYLSGEIISRTELHGTLAEAVGHPVTVLESPFKYDGGLDPARYLVNMAMAVRNSSRIRESTFPVAALNLLPAPYQPKPMSAGKLIAIPGGAAVVGLVVPMLLLMQTASANIAGLQKELDALNLKVNQKIVQQQQLKTEIAGLEKEVGTVQIAFNNLKASTAALAAGQEMVNGDLTLALSVAPPSIALTGVSESGGTLSLQGKTASEEDVLTYARSLDTSGRFVRTTISSLNVTPAAEGQGSPVYDFKLTLERK